MKRIAILMLGCIPLAMLLAAGDRAVADVLVLDSNVAGLKRGAQLEDEARLLVPAGKSVMIMRPSGETQEVSGPYDRLVRDISRGETIGENFKRMKSLIEQEATGKSIGATRGITR
jgi:hypothetical protein